MHICLAHSTWRLHRTSSSLCLTPTRLLSGSYPISLSPLFHPPFPLFPFSLFSFLLFFLFPFSFFSRFSFIPFLPLFLFSLSLFSSVSFLSFLFLLFLSFLSLSLSYFPSPFSHVVPDSSAILPTIS